MLKLNGTWDLTIEQELTGREKATIPVAVPGNLELALQEAGLAPDSFFDLGGLAYRKYEFFSWRFCREFEYNGGAKAVQLTFHRIDPYSEIYLNGVLLGKAGNGLIEHCFRCEKLLRSGNNELVVLMKSAVNHIRQQTLEPSNYSAYPFNYESLWVRKPAHVWGWDITPRLALGGIWGDVTLEELPEHRFGEIYVQTMQANPEQAALSLHYNFTTTLPDYSGLELEISGQCEKSKFQEKVPVWLHAGFARVKIPAPRLWNPRNYGEPNLYSIRLALLHEGQTIAEKTIRAGIRTLSLRRSDLPGRTHENAFAFIVNGTEVRIQGTNHVPLDALHSRDAERLPVFLDMLRDLNCNMVRVWGGGTYESDAFYDFCDENGILVWQDFMMGCATYPADQEFCEIIRQEAESVIHRLRQHPSLALWAGDNECDIFALACGLRLSPENIRVTREILPEVLRRLDPDRPWLASSPYFSPQVQILAPDGNQEFCPEKHLWGARNYYRTAYYAQPDASFVSEIGYHGCPSVSSLRRFLPEDKLWPWRDNPSWFYHASNPYLGSNDMLNYRIQLMADQIQEVFGLEPKNIEEFALLSQICQAEAKKFFIETARMNRPQQSGILWWNLLDCWPQFSDAVVDYYFNKKLAYFYIKRVQQPTCLMISEPCGWNHKVLLDNASALVAKGHWRVRTCCGQILAEGEFQAEPNTLIEVASLRISLAEQKLLLLDWKDNRSARGVNHYWVGSPPFSAKRYCQEYLPLLAEMDDSFKAAEIAR